MSERRRLTNIFKGRNVLIPLVLGLAAASLLIFYDFDYDELRSIHFGQDAWLWLGVAFICLILRDLGYVLRLRFLSESSLSWRQCFELTMLWEFASAITPGIIGGTAAAFVLLAQENIKTGRSTAIVLTTSFLDVLFYVLAVPCLFLISGSVFAMPLVELPNGGFVDASVVKVYFLVSFGILFLWALLVFIGLFIRPRIIVNTMAWIFSLPFLKRWKNESRQWQEEIVSTSREFGGKGGVFWLKSFGATVFSWVARFALVNCIVLAFGGLPDHMDLFINQLVMWCVLLIPFTPGASGMAEAIFPAFLSPFFASATIARLAAVLWRVISYYPFLIIGFFIFPIWMKRVLNQRKSIQRETNSEGGSFAND